MGGEEGGGRGRGRSRMRGKARVRAGAHKSRTESVAMESFEEDGLVSVTLCSGFIL